MKRILLAVAILAFALPAVPRAEARVDVSIDFFYENLSDGGSWIEVGDYGYCWQPSVAVSNAGWRPYADGYWAYTDQGWAWISYEDFGWATYHYGRWVRLRGRGWVWVPGREWAPAWVSWRTGGDYVGWAPLPPRTAGEYWDESPITARVDIDFDIGPAYYNFIEVRYIGEPVLRERIFAAEQNATYISRTVNVTNITSTNSQVYNYGPDYNTLSRYSTRPIQRLSLQRDTNVDPAAAAQSKAFMKVQGDKLVVAAPLQLQKPTKPIAPKIVKEKIAQAPVERGWEPLTDPKAQAELKEKMKKEDPKSIPPPTSPPSDKAAARPGASAAPPPPTASTSAPGASPSVSPVKDKNKRTDKISPMPDASASVTPAMSPGTPPEKKDKRKEKVPPPPTSSPSASPAPSAAPTRDKGKNKRHEKIAPSATVPPPVSSAAPNAVPKPSKEKSEKRKLETVAPAPPPAAAPHIAPPPVPETKHNKPGPDSTKPETSVDKPKHQPPADLAPKANPPVNPPPARDEGKKQKKNEPAVSPTP